MSLRARTTTKRARKRYPRTLSNMTAYFHAPTVEWPTGVPPIKERALKYRHSQKVGEVLEVADKKSKVLLFRAVMVISGVEDFVIPPRIR